MRTTRPSLKSPCVADRYHGTHERIAEFHFPNAQKGGLIALREIYNPKHGTYDSCEVAIYRQDVGVNVTVEKEAPTSTDRQLWAAYAGSADGSEITLHATENAALRAVVAALGIDVEGRELDLDDDEAIREALDDYCSTRADDYEVQEVELP